MPTGRLSLMLLMTEFETQSFKVDWRVAMMKILFLSLNMRVRKGGFLVFVL